MYVVMLSGEDASDSEVYGPFRSEQRAREVADAWDREHPDDLAVVKPILRRERMA